MLRLREAVSVYVVDAPPVALPTWPYGPPDVVERRTSYEFVKSVGLAIQVSVTFGLIESRPQLAPAARDVAGDIALAPIEVANALLMADHVAATGRTGPANTAQNAAIVARRACFALGAVRR